MNFIPYDIKKVGRNMYNKTENLRIIEEFAETGISCAKIIDFPQERSNVAANSLNNSAKRYGYNHIQFLSRKKELFVINTQLISSEEKL